MGPVWITLAKVVMGTALAAESDTIKAEVHLPNRGPRCHVYVTQHSHY